MWFFGSWVHPGWFAGFAYVVFAAIITLTIVKAVKSGKDGREQRRSAAPEDILKERLARGETDIAANEELLNKIR